MSAEEAATAPAVEKPEDAAAPVEFTNEQVEEEVTEEPKAVSSMSQYCS
jgi:hypothetical protein